MAFVEFLFVMKIDRITSCLLSPLFISLMKRNTQRYIIPPMTIITFHFARKYFFRSLRIFLVINCFVGASFLNRQFGFNFSFKSFRNSFPIMWLSALMHPHVISQICFPCRHHRKFTNLILALQDFLILKSDAGIITKSIFAFMFFPWRESEGWKIKNPSQRFHRVIKFD